MVADLSILCGWSDICMSQKGDNLDSHGTQFHVAWAPDSTKGKTETRYHNLNFLTLCARILAYKYHSKCP